MSPILELRSITKEYRDIPAVKDVNFSLESREIHALVGENGAGKSTLTKIIAGGVTPTSGEMLLDGKAVAFKASGNPRATRDFVDRRSVIPT
jgi:simple sugar transport system ATP-binding protein